MRARMRQSEQREAGGEADGSKRTIVVFARAPQLGWVKTRLAREIGPKKALDVCMLRDSLAMARAAAVTVEAEVVVAFTPGDALRWPSKEDAPALSELWRGAFWPQPEGDLGVRMHAALEWALEENASTSVILVGTDSPHLAPSELAMDLVRLERTQPNRLLLPAAEDGGFVRLGCRTLPPREIFAGIDWNQSQTREPLSQNARRLGWEVEKSGPPQLDIDDMASLRQVWHQGLQRQRSASPRLHDWVRANLGEWV
jgi:glycosyltransferase A (GT-A) superfamily protein (DUF2064 family)